MRPKDDLWETPWQGLDPANQNYTGPKSIGYQPDWNSLIHHDPGYLAAASAARENEATAAAQRRESIRRGLVQYGGDLSGWADKYGDIDQATRDLAGKNQFSTLNVLARQLSTSTRDMRRQLAARGMLGSGELGYGQNQLDVGYGQARYDAANALSDSFGNAVNQYTGVLGQNRTLMADAIRQAGSTVRSDPHNAPVVHADYDAGASSQAGQPVYSATGSDGVTHYYNQDGSDYVYGG